MTLDDRRIDVWTVDLDASASLVARFLALLAPEEAAHARALRVETLRHYAVARGTLRILLGRYLSTPPSVVELRTALRGKPFVDERIAFNLSHSGSLLLLAFTRGSELGIDVEIGRPLTDLVQIGTRFFSPEEAAELLALPDADRELAFYRCWTRKEAYIKATGDGLHAPLDRFRVTFREGDRPRLVHIDHDVRTASEWRLHDLHAGRAAALAYRDAERPLRLQPPMRAAEVMQFFEDEIHFTSPSPPGSPQRPGTPSSARRGTSSSRRR